jgi:NADH-quinone oxidoreductase subunit M
MILLVLILVLIGGAILAAALAPTSNAPRWISLGAVVADFLIGLSIWVRHYGQVSFLHHGHWIEELDWTWIPRFGIHFHLAIDGLSLLLVMLTFFLGIVSVLASWREIQTSIGFFHFNLLFVLAGIVGVFLAVDLFLFYFAWEVMLVPMYFLIAIWGHENRVYAAIKFFLFTQLSSLLMLIAILTLYFLHHASTGVYTFEYDALLGTQLSSHTALLLMLGFFVAFAVKLPMVPLHTWLPDAHTEAPTAGSVILAGLLLKTGAYGMLRFVVPLFPSAAHQFAPYAMALGAAGIVYGAVLAFGQTDLKRLVAYSSVSHLGFVLIGIFAWNDLALEGALMGMLAHGLSTGALFVIVGALQERTETRQIERLQGLWATIPRLSGVALFFALGSLGLPGLGDFVGEFLVLQGTYHEHLGVTVVGAIGILASTLYALRFVQGAFYGPNIHDWRLPDLFAREVLALAPMIAVLVWLGIYPQPIFNTFRPAMAYMENNVAVVQSVPPRSLLGVEDARR